MDGRFAFARIPACPDPARRCLVFFQTRWRGLALHPASHTWWLADLRPPARQGDPETGDPPSLDDCRCEAGLVRVAPRSCAPPEQAHHLATLTAGGSVLLKVMQPRLTAEFRALPLPDRSGEPWRSPCQHPDPLRPPPPVHRTTVPAPQRRRRPRPVP